MQGADQQIRSSSGFSILPKDTLTWRLRESNQRSSDNNTLAQPLSPSRHLSLNQPHMTISSRSTIAVLLEFPPSLNPAMSQHVSPPLQSDRSTSVTGNSIWLWLLFFTTRRQVHHGLLTLEQLPPDCPPHGRPVNDTTRLKLKPGLEQFDKVRLVVVFPGIFLCLEFVRGVSELIRRGNKKKIKKCSQIFCGAIVTLKSFYSGGLRDPVDRPDGK